MKLLEYEAKGVLAKDGVPIPKGALAQDDPAFLPAVLKSQVPTGGRGKAGGIVIAKTAEEYGNALAKLKTLEVKGYVPRSILAEELLGIKTELYLSLLVDKNARAITVMAHRHGGVEVEDNDEGSYFTLILPARPDFDAAGQQLADYYDLPDKTFVLQDLLQKIHGAFIRNDALLIEINPLVVTHDGDIVAGDCKMELDDAAAFRHPEWAFETGKAEVNFVTLDQNGDVATIANGAGLAMATVDAVADAGMRPANFLDIGGGANEASVLAAFERLVTYPNLKVIIINIFAGITRCDEVAKAIVTASEKLPGLPALSVRLAGTNYEQAADILQRAGMTIQPSLELAIKRAKQETR